MDDSAHSASRWIDPVRAELQAMYSEPHRHYHNMGHIRHCLRELQEVRERCDDPVAVEVAIWFHDCVYEPTRHDNEKRSAQVAAEMLQRMGADDLFVNRVKSLIVATQHVDVPCGNDQQFLVDIDLAILGRPQEEFDHYELAIRKEYAHVPHSAFKKGREAILRSFLERRAIFNTQHFQDKYEATARSNLRKSIRQLTENDSHQS